MCVRIDAEDRAEPEGERDPTPEISLRAAETNTIRLSTTKTPMYPSTAPARTPAIIGSRQRSRPAQKSAKPLTGALRCR